MCCVVECGGVWCGMGSVYAMYVCRVCVVCRCLLSEHRYVMRIEEENLPPVHTLSYTVHALSTPSPLAFHFFSTSSTFLASASPYSVVTFRVSPCLCPCVSLCVGAGAGGGVCMHVCVGVACARCCLCVWCVPALQTSLNRRQNSKAPRRSAKLQGRGVSPSSGSCSWR